MKKLLIMITLGVLTTSANATFISVITKSLTKPILSFFKVAAPAIPVIAVPRVSSQLAEDIDVEDLKRASKFALIAVVTIVDASVYVVFKTFNELDPILSFKEKEDRINKKWLGTAERNSGVTYSFGEFDSYFKCRDEANYKKSWECTEVNVFKQTTN